VGNSVGVVLPRELLDRLRIAKGDSLFAIETTKGLVLTPYSPELEAQLTVAEKVMREDRDVLRKLGQ